MIEYTIDSDRYDLDQLVEIMNWCDEKFGEEAEGETWFIDPHQTYNIKVNGNGLVIGFKTVEMFSEFVLRWG